jgi:hypothetical protein
MEVGMSIRNELEALRRQMKADHEREYGAMGSVAGVFAEIEEARQRGFTELAHVFANLAGLDRPAQPLEAQSQYGLAAGAQVGIAAAPQPDPFAKVYVGGPTEQRKAYTSHPLTDPHAYEKAVAEAYGDPNVFAGHYDGAQQQYAAEQVAQRYASAEELPPEHIARRYTPYPNGRG